MPNAYPRINGPPPIHMQRPPPQQGNLIHPPYPATQQFNNAPGAAPNAPAPAPPYPNNTRPREWEPPSQPVVHERDPKRMRAYPPQNPAPAPYPPNQHASFNRPPPPQPLSAPYPPNAQPQHPGMVLNNPPIHPPNQQAIAFQQRQQAFPQPAPMPPTHRTNIPPVQSQRDSFQYPPKVPAQFPGPPAQIPTAQVPYNGIPPPPRKDLGASLPGQTSGAGPTMPAQQGSTNVKDAGEQPLSFKDFLVKQPDNISSQDAQAAYDRYVREFARGRPNTFFDQHHEQEWFRERYDPEYVSKRMLRIREEVTDRAKVFRDLWDVVGRDGCAPELTLEGSKAPRRAHVAKGGQHTNAKEDKQTCAMDKAKEEDNSNSKSELKFEGDEDSKAEPSPSAEGKEESDIAAQNDKAEDKLEPSLKVENETEATEDAEQKVSGLKPAIEEKENSVSPNLPANSPLLQLPLRREHQKDTIFMRGIPLNLNREDLTAVLRHGPDGATDLGFRRLKLGDINPQRALERFGWAVYASEEAAARALEVVRGVRVVSKKRAKKEKDDGSGETGKKEEGNGKEQEESQNTYVIDCMLNLERRKKFNQGRVLPTIFATKDRLRYDVEQSVKMMRRLDGDRKLNEDINPLTDKYLEELQNDGERLDHVVTFLREVHYFCYFSGNEFLEDPTSMPPQELRPTKERGRPMTEADSRLVRRIDERAKWVMERDYDRPRSNSENGEAMKEKAVRSWLDANTRVEGPNRFRCGLPPHKLFKGPEFVHKHLRIKHADKMKDVMKEAMLDTYRSNFDNDPSKEEVISIFNEGMAGLLQRQKGRSQNDTTRNQGYNNNNDYGRPGASVPLPMYNPGMNPMMMQQYGMMPSMMMTGSGFNPGYAGAPGYPNTMAFPGPGMNAGRGGAPGMTSGGMTSSSMKPGESNSGGPPRRPSARHHPGNHHPGGHHREYRDDGHRGRRGGHMRRGGDRHRGGHDGRPVDPRSRGTRRSYNDLDAPSNGPAFDLVRYDDV